MLQCICLVRLPFSFRDEHENGNLNENPYDPLLFYSCYGNLVFMCARFQKKPDRRLESIENKGWNQYNRCNRCNYLYKKKRNKIRFKWIFDEYEKKNVHILIINKCRDIQNRINSILKWLTGMSFVRNWSTKLVAAHRVCARVCGEEER